MARHHDGRLGKEDNCQDGVVLVGVTPAGSALLDHPIFLPESWCESMPEACDRRERAHISEDVGNRTKPRFAAELIRDVAAPGRVVRDWVVADDEYGREGLLLDELEGLGQRNVLEGPATTADPVACVPADTGWGRRRTRPARDSARAAARVAAELPASAWEALQVREGAKGPLVFELAVVHAWGIRHRTPGPPAWLLIRRAPGAGKEPKYDVSDAGAETPPSMPALMADTRDRVEEFLEDCKGDLGMSQDETRSWVGGHHHRTPVGLAYLLETLTRLRLGNESRP